MRRPALVASLFLILLIPCLASALTPAEQLALQVPVDTGRIVLRFSTVEGLRMDSSGPASSLAGAALSFESRLTRLAPGAGLERRFSGSPEALDGLRARAESRGARDLVDLNRYAQLENLSADRSARLALVKALLADPAVDMAWLEPVAVPAALGFDAFTGAVPEAQSSLLTGERDTPDFSGYQGYLNDAPEGVGAWSVAGVPGAYGSTVSVMDIEGAWLWTHEDLPAPLAELGGAVESLSWRNHGTAVLGEIRGSDNGCGVRGIAPGCAVGGSSIEEQSVADAILNAAAAVEAGDILLIELHAPGPNSNGSGQYGYLPMEFWQDNFDAIRTVTALGRIVCEAAGNGAQDLDDAVYMNLFDRDLRDSGAIMCGATHGSEFWPAEFTNYGDRVDLHGWGYYVATCAYGGLQGEPLPEEEWYTEGFSGTSSASPIVVGAVASLQGMVESAYGFSLDASLVRQILVPTGTPQEEPGRHIGPRPDLVAAWGMVGSTGLGRISGTVTDAVSGDPLPGVAIEVAQTDAFLKTDAVGHYELVLLAGAYGLSYEEFFHDGATSSPVLADEQDLTLDIAMDPLALTSVGGTVQGEDDALLADVHVEPRDVPVTVAWTDASGHFDLLSVPEGADFPLLLGRLPGYGAAWLPGLYVTGLPGGREELPFGILLPDADMNFEADDGGFTTDGNAIWSWGTPTAGGPPAAFSGTNCWGVGMNGDYGDDEYGSILSPSYDFSSESRLVLSFHYWRSSESGFDGARVQVWQGGAWQPVEPVSGYSDILLGGLSNEPGWSGSSDHWEPAVFEFTAAELSADFRFRLDFGSDGGLTGEGFWIDDISLFAGGVVTAADGIEPAAARATLAAWPNPFNPSTTIRWALPGPGELRVEAFDVKGRRVRRLFDGPVATTSGSLNWDGRDDGGRALPSGLYLLRLSSERGLVATGRAILLK